MTALPGAIPGINTSRMQAAKAGSSIAKFKQCDVRILRDKLAAEVDICSQFSGPDRVAHRQDLHGTLAPDLSPPSPARGGRYLQAASGLSPCRPFADQPRKSGPEFLWQRCWHDAILQIRVNLKSDPLGIPPVQTFLATLWCADVGGAASAWS